MSADKQDSQVKKDLQATADDLKRLTDEIRVKLHLAGMDAKEAWEKIQPRIEEFGKRFDETAGDVDDELRKLGAEIKTRLRSIIDKIKSA
jgi:ElaB/YqjD/DUF883 family membrane-anchored ribosome-binding protein